MRATKEFVKSVIYAYCWFIIIWSIILGTTYREDMEKRIKCKFRKHYIPLADMNESNRPL